MPVLLPITMVLLEVRSQSGKKAAYISKEQHLLKPFFIKSILLSSKLQHWRTELHSRLLTGEAKLVG